MGVLLRGHRGWVAPGETGYLLCSRHKFSFQEHMVCPQHGVCERCTGRMGKVDIPAWRSACWRSSSGSACWYCLMSCSKAAHAAWDSLRLLPRLLSSPAESCTGMLSTTCWSSASASWACHQTCYRSAFAVGVNLGGMGGLSLH